MHRKSVVIATMLAGGSALCIGMGIQSHAQQGQSPAPGHINQSAHAKNAPGSVHQQRGTYAVSAISAGSENVLFYEDVIVGDESVYEATLNALGWSYTFTGDPNIFADELNSGDYTHVIAAHQSSGGVQGYETALLDWIDANPNGAVLISDWRTADPAGYLAELGFSHGATNFETILPIAGELFDGLPTAALDNPGWGVYSYETLGGTTLAIYDAGNPIIARIGNVFFNGFLSDTFEDISIGIEYVTRELLEGVVEGACCISCTGGCAVMDGSMCAALGGEFHVGLTCGQIPCVACPADLNGSGAVGVADLLILLENWGPCPEPEECEVPFVCGVAEFDLCGPNDECFCWATFDGGFGCVHPNTSCSGLDECPDGNCPPGHTCMLDSCCPQGGGDVCIPNEWLDCVIPAQADGPMTHTLGR